MLVLSVDNVATVTKKMKIRLFDTKIFNLRYFAYCFITCLIFSSIVILPFNLICSFYVRNHVVAYTEFAEQHDSTFKIERNYQVFYFGRNFFLIPKRKAYTQDLVLIILEGLLLVEQEILLGYISTVSTTSTFPMEVKSF